MRFLSVLLISSAVLAQEGSLRILRHDLTVEIDPASGRFKSVDRMKVEGKGEIKYDLPDGAIAEVTEPSDGVWVVAISGTMNNPVQKSDAATWVAGDRTYGIISEQGSYLHRGFYVQGKTSCPYRITIRVPLPHRAVTVGKLVAEKDGEVTYETGYDVDGIVIVTGPWVVDEREMDGVKCRTYLYESDRKHSKLILDSLAVEIPRYQKLFGAVPDKRFDVVENFFATGYGFSNFTLLGDTVIRYVSRQARGVWPAGYLDHELVHCWLGNYLHVDYERGNWCEALTTYFTNYGAAVREKRDAAYRRKVSRTFSLRVGKQNDYPLRSFKKKRHDFENDIGYGKGSMVFHMLAREIGRDKLIEGVRRAIKDHGGKRIGWDDLARSLGAEEWLKPWLERTGAPVLELGRVQADGNRIVGTLRQAQDGAAYDLKVPVRVVTADGVEDHIVVVRSKEVVFAITTKAAPQRVELDPDHHIFRRVRREHVPPCMLGVLTAPKKVGFGHADLLARVSVTEIEPALPSDAAVLAIGLAPKVRGELIAGARQQEPSFLVHERSFELFGKTYDQPGDSILLSFRRGRAPGLPVTLFHGNSEAAYARVTYLPYYASHSWVVFRNGRPLARGEFSGDRYARRTIREGEPDRILWDLLLLTDPVHKGREAGSDAAYRLANTLRGRLFQTGAKVLKWSAVSMVSGSCSKERRITLLDGDDKLHIDDGFFPFHASASPARPAVFDRVVTHPHETPRGALVILPEDGTFQLALEYAEKGAAVVAVEGTGWKRAAEAAWVGAVPEGVKGSPNSLMARNGWRNLKIPYLYLKLPASNALKKHRKGGVVRFRLKRTMTDTQNIVGVIGGGKVPGVLLSAHWDGVGVIDGKVAQGAADNATGVAIVLWVAEQMHRIAMRRTGLKRPVIVALFGGEEKGLWGSRQFAQAMLQPQSKIAKPWAMVNVDGVGSGKSGELYLIGRSHHPALLRTCERAIKGLGLSLGRDIDRFAFAYGSDHWPLHEAGVPAVTVFNANYRSINTLRDRLADVDVGLVRQTAKVVLRMVRELATK